MITVTDDGIFQGEFEIMAKPEGSAADLEFRAYYGLINSLMRSANRTVEFTTQAAWDDFIETSKLIRQWNISRLQAANMLG